MVAYEEQKAQEKAKKDKTLVVLLVASLFAVLYFGLNSALFLLGYNTMLLAIVLLMSLPFAQKYIFEKDTEVGILILIPILIRIFLSNAIYRSASFTAFSAFLQDMKYGVEISLLLVIIALSEETFRAAILSLMELYNTIGDPEIRRITNIIVSNSCWVSLHFVQRPFLMNEITLAYVIWLFVSGIILTYILQRSGLGTAALAHFLLNLTA